MKFKEFLNDRILEETDDSNEVEFGYRARKKKNAYLYYLLKLAEENKKNPIKDARDREALERYINEPILKDYLTEGYVIENSPLKFKEFINDTIFLYESDLTKEIVSSINKKVNELNKEDSIKRIKVLHIKVSDNS